MPGNSLYSASAVTVIAPFPLTDGLPDEGFIKITPADDVSDDEQGADGHVTIILKKCNRWDIEINLMYGSKHNEQYSALFAVHANNETGAAIGAFLMKDNNGATMYSFPHLVPRTHAGTDNGSAGKMRTWKFRGIGNAGGAISGGNAI